MYKVIGLLMSGAVLSAAGSAPRQPLLDGTPANQLVVGDLRFRDLNHDGRLAPYEDWRLPPAVRAHDLLKRMTLEEKVGLMMHGTAPAKEVPGHGAEFAHDGAPTDGGTYGEGTRYDLEKSREIILHRHVMTMVTRLDCPPDELARQNNLLQEIAATTRLGIPLTLSSDPRNHFEYTPGASVAAKGFSKWPEPLGFGAMRDANLVRHFGDIVRREFRATGIRMLLGPQADLSTDPRWPRVNGTFGEDSKLVSDLVGAFVEGSQGGMEGPSTDGLLTIVKHWVGYGAAATEGFDSHNYYGRFAAFPGNRLDDHVRAFDGAFAAHAAGIMPTYSILRDAKIDGAPIEPVGAGFSRQLMEVALRQHRRYAGLLISDFAITEDCNQACREGSKPGEPFGISMAWGVDHMTKIDRFALGINAGLDEYGGTEEVEPLIAAVKARKVRLARIDSSVARILQSKFAIGEFERAFVDPTEALRVLEDPVTQAEGQTAQESAMVLLENRDSFLPLKPGTRVFVRGLSADDVRAAGLVVVSDPTKAQAAIVRMSAPFRLLHPQYMFGSVQHEGSLDFATGDRELVAIRRLAAQLPVVPVIYLDRPAILTQIRPLARALLADFGASDAAVANVIAGKARPKGRLPVELPLSMEAVATQLPDVASDSENPLYPVGYGLSYKN